VEISRKSAQKIAARFDAVRSRVLATPEFFARHGRVETTWRKYDGRQLGPYYRLVFADDDAGRTSIYLGCSVELARRVQELLADLQKPHRERRLLCQLRRSIRVSLRAHNEEVRKCLLPLGFRMKGSAIHRRRPKDE
jgi:hypothetical protein